MCKLNVNVKKYAKINLGIHSKKHVTSAVILMLTLIDIITYTIVVETSTSGVVTSLQTSFFIIHGEKRSRNSELVSDWTWFGSGREDDTAGAVRWSRPIRPFLIINFPEPRQIRARMRNIRNSLPNIFYVIVLLFASVAVFSLMAMKLLGKSLENLDRNCSFVQICAHFPRSS